MLLVRYLIKEIVSTWVLMTTLLLAVFFSNQLVRYFSRIADGKIPLHFLLQILLLEIPNLASLLLPMGVFLAILLAFGRLYADNEMTAMFACGLSMRRLMTVTLGLVSVIALAAAYLACIILPNIAVKRQQLLHQQGSAAALTALQPGRFQRLPNHRVVYIGKTRPESGEFREIFIAEPAKSKTKAGSPRRGGPVSYPILLAQSGRAFAEQNLLIVKHGKRYQGVPGKGDFTVIEFAKLGVTLKPGPARVRDAVKMVPTAELWQKRQQAAYRAEWQWRWSIPLMLFILAFIAIPLSRVEPRQGKLARVIPAVIILVIYGNGLFVFRRAISEAHLPAWPGLWSVHLAFFCLGVVMLLWQNGQFQWSLRRLQ